MNQPILHITNGDIAAGLLRRSDVMGTVLPWRDILHEGPVPAGLAFAELSRLRVRFLEEAGFAADGEAQAAFAERDAALRASGGHVVLWFEHDLYDQLQLLQLLDWFRERPPETLELIEVGEFPGIAKFEGLGQLTASQMSSLMPHRRSVSAEMTALAARAWASFRAEDPRGLEAILAEDTFVLPFLQDALIRHLQDFPSVEEGLPRTEHNLLEAVTDDRSLLHLFRAVQAREERPYMGDSVIRYRLGGLATGRAPLVTGRGRRLSFDLAGPAFWEQEVVLTETGRRYLAGGSDWFADAGVDRWLGGVHLHPGARRWRWSRSGRRLREIV